MAGFEIAMVFAALALAAAAWWCWSEVRRTARNWRMATFTTVCVAVVAAVVSETMTGGTIRGGWQADRFASGLGGLLAGAGWIGVAIAARVRRRH